jgi:small subunit ribosomal protein S17
MSEELRFMAEEPEETPPEDETAPETPSAEAEAGPAEEAPEAAAVAPAEPEAPVAPKERRRRTRAARAAAPPRPQLSPEERQAERAAERRRQAGVRSARRKHEREKARAARDGQFAQPMEPRREQHPGQQKTRQGIVVSDRASKTIVVRIDVARRHRSYDKVVRTSTTLHAHDEREDAHTGDTVIVRESRPLSRTKRWRLVEVVERAK